MKHESKRLENSAVELKICLTADEVKGLREEVVKKVATKVEVPGFRKGKAPISTVEAQFKDAINEELRDTVLGKYYEEVLREENISPISYPYALNVNYDNGFEATMKVDVYPEIELGNYKGLEVEKEKFEMTSEVLEKEIEKILNSKSELKDAEEGHKAQMGDVVDLAFEGFVDGVAFEGGKSDSHSLKLGSKQFIDTFEEQLVGYTVGQEGEVNVNFPTEYHAENLAGKPATFKVKVNAIKNLIVPTLNEEIAKELGYENVEDLKAGLTQDITSREENRVKNEYIGKLLAEIEKNSKIELPASMVAREIDNRIAEMEHQLAAQGMKLDMYLQFTGMNMEMLKNQIAPMAIGKIKTDLILEKIAETEKLEVADTEIKERTEKIASSYGMTVEKLEEELAKHKNLEAFKANLKVDILMEKAVDFIVNNAK